MSRHATVWIGGRDVTPDTFGELSIAGGRSTFRDTPDAVTLSLSLDWPTFQPIPRVGETVSVLGWLPGDTSGVSDRALFHGHVTDVALEGDVVSVLAVDPLRRLDGVYIGDQPWPMELFTPRMDRILQSGRAMLSPEDAAWFGTGQNPNEPWYWCAFGGNRYPWRDVDRQELLQILEGMLGPVGVAMYYMPHNHRNGSERTPPHPSQWRPCTGSARIGSPQYPPPMMARVESAAIAADYRVFMNLGPLTNEWKVTGQWLTPAGRPVEPSDTQPAEWQVFASTDQAGRTRYGPATGSLDFGSGLIAGVHVPDAYPAQFWRERTGYPTWGADNVIIPLDSRTVEADRARARNVWLRVLALGPGACGFRVALQGVRGSSYTDSAGYLEWVVEGLQVDWLEDGWDITLTSLSDPAVYFGTATADPVDPRSAVSLEQPVPDMVPASGVLLRPLWFHGGVQGATGGYWRVAVAGTGQFGPTVPNTGTGSLLPTGTLPVGRQRLVVQRLPNNVATTPTDWLEVEVTVVSAYTWQDLPNVPWSAVPVELTWSAAAAATDWLEG